ncbi:hypothetical protein DO70_3513 [Burkholderia pseudomallei]|nr:hypothetical protein DO70_3513 [Burkholderia pseudomallei]
MVQEGGRRLIVSEDLDGCRCRSLATTASIILEFQCFNQFQQSLKWSFR